MKGKERKGKTQGKTGKETEQQGREMIKKARYENEKEPP